MFVLKLSGIQKKIFVLMKISQTLLYIDIDLLELKLFVKPLNVRSSILFKTPTHYSYKYE